MRIAQVANFVHPTSGGIGTAMHSLGIEYTRLGHEVIEVVPESGDAHFDHRHPYRQTVTSVRLPLSGGYRIVVRRVELARVLEEFRPDIVELHDKSTLYWLPGWCRSRGITCIVFSHERTDLVPDGRTILARPLRVAISAARRRIETEAEAIVCASAFAAAEFDPVVGGAPVHIIPLGIDLDMFAPVGIDRSWGTPLRVVMCNRLSAEKGVLEAVRGLVELSRGVPVSLTVMGDGPLREAVASTIANAGSLEGRLLGHVVDRTVVAHELATADVVVNMGPRETFGLVTLEAMASGTPVVVAETGGSSELVNETFGAVSPVCASSIRTAIESLVSRDRPELARAARDAAKRFGWSTVATSILELASSPVVAIQSMPTCDVDG